MNYFLLALALAAAIVTLLYVANIVRVAAGRLTWGSTAAMIVHIVVAPTAGVLAFWLFQIAVAR